MKQEDFRGAVALAYFVENVLRFTIMVFKERRHLYGISHLVSRNKSIYLRQNIYNFCSDLVLFTNKNIHI